MSPAQPLRPPASFTDPLTSANGRLLTADDVANRWQVLKSQVYRLTREDRLPAVKLGRYYRYRLDALEEFERSGGVGDG